MNNAMPVAAGETFSISLTNPGASSKYFFTMIPRITSPGLTACFHSYTFSGTVAILPGNTLPPNARAESVTDLSTVNGLAYIVDFSVGTEPSRVYRISVPFADQRVAMGFIECSGYSTSTFVFDANAPVLYIFTTNAYWLFILLGSNGGN